VRITANAPLDNSFADLDIDLINEQNNEVESVSVPIEYYQGSDSDGAWTEGAQTQDATLSSFARGKYTLRVEGTWQNFRAPLAGDGQSRAEYQSRRKFLSGVRRAGAAADFRFDSQIYV
jgi:hypothetical protein